MTYPAKIIYTTKKHAYVEFDADSVLHKLGYDDLEFVSSTDLESVSSTESDCPSQSDTSKKRKSRRNRNNRRNKNKKTGNQKPRTDNTDKHRDGNDNDASENKGTSTPQSESKETGGRKNDRRHGVGEGSLNTPIEEENQPDADYSDGEHENSGCNRKTKGRKRSAQGRKANLFRHTYTETHATRAGSTASNGDEGRAGAESERELYFGDDLDAAKDIQTGLRPGNEFRSLRTLTTGINKTTIKSECQYSGCPAYRLRFTVEPEGTSRAIGFACAVFVVF